MALSKEDVIRAVAAKVGPGITLEAKLEKGIWRIALTKEGKSASLEFKRGFLDDYFEKGFTLRISGVSLDPRGGIVI